jgi:hypothetical protein
MSRILGERTQGEAFYEEETTCVCKVPETGKMRKMWIKD